jgi:hypothetical protein
VSRYVDLATALAARVVSYTYLFTSCNWIVQRNHWPHYVYRMWNIRHNLRLQRWDRDEKDFWKVKVEDFRILRNRFLFPDFRRKRAPIPYLQ